jgi:hypothetical protein
MQDQQDRSESLGETLLWGATIVLALIATGILVFIGLNGSTLLAR